MSVGPALVGEGQVGVAGKAGIAYLLDGSRPAGIGGEQARLVSACGGEVAGGSAILGDTVVLPCLVGPVAVRVTAAPPGLGVVWRAGVGGGPPILAAGRVWTIGRDGVLYGLDPASGAVRQQVAIGAVANHFPTPSAGDGLLVAAAARRVIAFRTAASQTPSVPLARPTHSATSSAAATGGGSSSGLVWGVLAGAVVVLAALGALVWWHRR